MINPIRILSDEQAKEKEHKIFQKQLGELNKINLQKCAENIDKQHKKKEITMNLDMIANEIKKALNLNDIRWKRKDDPYDSSEYFMGKRNREILRIRFSAGKIFTKVNDEWIQEKGKFIEIDE